MQTTTAHAPATPSLAPAPSFPSDSSFPAGGDARVLFLSCADFPVSASRALGTDPRDVVELRTPGQTVPRHRLGAYCGVAAGIESALTRLPVEEIVLCGHTGCAAVREMWDGGAPAGRQQASRGWRDAAAPDPAHFDGAMPEDPERVRAAERRHLLTQLHHLRTHSCVTRRLVTRRLRVHTWYYDDASGRVECWDAERRRFRNL